MILSEENARSKWCPFARLPHGDVCSGSSALAAVNRSPDEKARCLASGCMLWRWYEHEGEGDAMRGYCSLSGEVRPLDDED